MTESFPLALARHRTTQGGRTANQWLLPHGWLLNFVKNITIFEASSTGRQGRQPNASYRSVGLANFVKNLTIFRVSRTG
jgi:hypothetical protein